MHVLNSERPLSVIDRVDVLQNLIPIGFYKQVKSPSEEKRNTHHYYQKNIMIVAPMTEGICDEKGKVSLQ